MEYTVSRIDASDRRGQSAVDRLLLQSGIRRDGHLDYTCGVYDEEGELCATGSCFANTLRCMAVRDDLRSEGLMNQVVSHLSAVQAERGNAHLFLYTKPASASSFGYLGFYEIARVPDKLVFMENRRTGFQSWLDSQRRSSSAPERTAAVVMNANPFTLGHRYLLEQACLLADAVHLFVLSENYGPIPAADRKRLVALGTADMGQVLLHDSGPYIISSATFPEYFLQGSDEVATVHARLDLAVFTRIATAMGIGVRFVGEEPFSRVTALYNQVMQDELPKNGIRCGVIPRCAVRGRPISASAVRQAIHDGQPELARELVPSTTWKYLTGEDGRQAVTAMQQAP